MRFLNLFARNASNSLERIQLTDEEIAAEIVEAKRIKLRKKIELAESKRCDKRLPERNHYIIEHIENKDREPSYVCAFCNTGLWSLS